MPWDIHIDPESGVEYYHNPVSGETCWELPEDDPLAVRRWCLQALAELNLPVDTATALDDTTLRELQAELRPAVADARLVAVLSRSSRIVLTNALSFHPWLLEPAKKVGNSACKPSHLLD